MRIYNCILLFIALTFMISAQAQDSALIKDISSKYPDKIADKASRLGEQLDKKTRKTLVRWKKQEERIQNKLAAKDSLSAAAIFGNASQQYSQLEQKLQSKSALQQYIPSLDTLSSSLRFLQVSQQLHSSTKGAKGKIDNALSKVKGMELQFQKAEDLKAFLRQRRQYLKEQLSQLGFAKELKQLNKQAYYYSAQVSEYKSLLKDHKKAERKALDLLSKSKVFKDFMRKNSMLSSLFRIPGDPDDPASPVSLAGLQTRAQVNGLLQQQIAAGSSGAQQQLQQNIQSAQSELNKVKEKLLKVPNTGTASGEAEAEFADSFKPNNQKTKSFLNRFELGTNIQSQKANGFFPTTSDLGVSLGYKFNDNSIIGIGGSYKIGFGQNIRHIKITHQGLGLRSFADWKIKGSFWLSGGYEMNFRSEFDNIEQLRGLDNWQQSGLVGLSKVVSLKTRFFKKTKVQLLWDFLSYQQVPKTQSVLFRIGYNF